MIIQNDAIYYILARVRSLFQQRILYFKRDFNKTNRGTKKIKVKHILNLITRFLAARFKINFK